MILKLAPPENDSTCKLQSESVTVIDAKDYVLPLEINNDLATEKNVNQPNQKLTKNTEGNDSADAAPNFDDYTSEESMTPPPKKEHVEIPPDNLKIPPTLAFPHCDDWVVVFGSMIG